MISPFFAVQKNKQTKKTTEYTISTDYTFYITT